jgi:hypothetical protein
MARAYRFTIIRVPASSLERAYEIIGRLTAIGLPRQSMNVTPHEDDSYHVAVHTQARHRERIMRAAESPAGQHLSSAVVAGTLLGGAALLGAGLWAMWRNSGRVQGFFGGANNGLRSSRLVADQDRATRRAARGDRRVPDRSGRTEQTEQPFSPHEGGTLGGGGHTTATTSGQSGLGSGQYTSREQSASNIGVHTGGFTGGGSAGQAGAPRQPTNTEPADRAVKAGTDGSVHKIS